MHIGQSVGFGIVGVTVDFVVARAHAAFDMRTLAFKFVLHPTLEHVEPQGKGFEVRRVQVFHGYRPLVAPIVGARAKQTSKARIPSGAVRRRRRPRLIPLCVQ
jgi:hypothetical protein